MFTLLFFNNNFSSFFLSFFPSKPFFLKLKNTNTVKISSFYFFKRNQTRNIKSDIGKENQTIVPGYWNHHPRRRCGTRRRGSLRRRHHHHRFLLRRRLLLHHLLRAQASSSGAPCDRDRRRARPNRIRRRKVPGAPCWRNARRTASTLVPRGTTSLHCSLPPFSL